MQKIVYLHIGLPKTATSHIQTTFQGNQALLHGHGIHYLQAGQHPLFHDFGNHLLAISLMKNRWEEVALSLNIEELADVWQFVRDEIDASCCQAFVASSEWFAFDIHERWQIDQIKQELSNYRVAIVVVLRDVVDYINSAYAQSIRDGNARSLSNYIEEAWYSLNWGALVARWAAVFGEDNVMAFRFEDMRASGVVPGLFRGIFGREGALSEEPPRNKSLPYHATMMMRMVNSSTMDDEEKIAFRNTLKSFFERHSDKFAPGSYIDADMARILRRNCSWPHLVQTRPLPSAEVGS